MSYNKLIKGITPIDAMSAGSNRYTLSVDRRRNAQVGNGRSPTRYNRRAERLTSAPVFLRLAPMRGRGGKSA